MGLISFLAIGLAAGWLAGQIMKGKGFGLVGNIIVGVIGAVLGGLLFGLLGLSAQRHDRLARDGDRGRGGASRRGGASEESLVQEKKPFSRSWSETSALFSSTSARRASAKFGWMRSADLNSASARFLMSKDW